MTPGLADTSFSSLSRTCSLPESRRRDDTADADADVAHPRQQPSTNSAAMGSPRRRYVHGGAQSSRVDDHRGNHGGDDHRGDRGGDDHKASTLTATTCLTASIEMEANQETHGGRHTAVKLLPSCRDGGDLSYGGSFPKSDTNKVGHKWRRTRETHGGRHEY